MEQLSFDAAGFIEFDLNAGQIRSAGNETLALVPFNVLAALEPGEDLKKTAQEWGLLHGNRLSEKIADSGKSAGINVLADHLGGIAATMGMGRVRIEIRGDALIFKARTESKSNASAGALALVNGFITGYLNALGEHRFEGVSLGEIKGEQCFWVGNSFAAQKVRKFINEGVTPLAAVERLAEGSC